MATDLAPSSRGSWLLSYLLPLSLLWGLVGTFMYVQYHNEKAYKATALNAQLQVLNHFVLYRLEAGDTPSQALHAAPMAMANVRLTLIDLKGRVVYDNYTDIATMGNHAHRQEVAEALQHGQGHTVNRRSESNHIPYFYAATRGKHYVLRSALPYTVSLQDTLRTNSSMWWLVVGLTLAISVVFVLLLRIVKQRDRGRQRLLEQEQEKIRLKRQLTNNINHELKTPVASIQVCLETLIGGTQLSPEQQAKLIDRCYQSCQRLRSLLRDVSLITRVEEGTSIIAREQVCLNDIVSDLAAELALYPLDKRLALTTDWHEDVVVQGNASLIVSIFRNLTENAMAYAEGTAIHIALLTNDTESCTICFEDNGVGVDPKHLPHLFERFYRVDKGRSRQTGGTGLGLAIVKHAVLFHGGTISVSNKPQGGLRFVFTLRKDGLHAPQ